MLGGADVPLGAASGIDRTSEAGEFGHGEAQLAPRAKKSVKARCQLRPHRVLRGCVAGPVGLCRITRDGQGAPGDGGVAESVQSIDRPGVEKAEKG